MRQEGNCSFKFACGTRAPALFPKLIGSERIFSCLQFSREGGELRGERGLRRLTRLDSIVKPLESEVCPSQTLMHLGIVRTQRARLAPQVNRRLRLAAVCRSNPALPQAIRLHRPLSRFYALRGSQGGSDLVHGGNDFQSLFARRNGGIKAF